MKYCTHCGSPIENDAKFCSFCGQPICEHAIESDSDFFDEPNESGGDDFFGEEHLSSISKEDEKNIAEEESKRLARAPIILRIISFFFPIVGLILYCVWNKEYKRKAKDVGIPALVGFIISFVAEIIYYTIMIANL